MFVDLKQTTTFFSLICVDASKSEKDEVDSNFAFDERAKAWEIAFIDLKAVKLPGPEEKYIWENLFISKSFKQSFNIIKIPSILLLLIFFFINLISFFLLYTANDMVWLEQKRDNDNIQL